MLTIARGAFPVTGPARRRRASVARWLVGSLARWLAGSLARWLARCRSVAAQPRRSASAAHRVRDAAGEQGVELLPARRTLPVPGDGAGQRPARVGSCQPLRDAEPVELGAEIPRHEGVAGPDR